MSLADDADFFDAVADDVMRDGSPQEINGNHGTAEYVTFSHHQHQEFPAGNDYQSNGSHQHHPRTTRSSSRIDSGHGREQGVEESYQPMAVTQTSPEPSPTRSSQQLRQQQRGERLATTARHDVDDDLKVEFSRTEGSGQWAAWQRNFESPLKALLDLFDNAVDACFVTPLQQELALASNPSMSSKPPVHPTIDVSLDSYGDTYGLVMRNTCREEVPPIKQVLNVNTRSKEHKSDQIGENGVGAKQACANLSDLSFVLIKSPKKYSLGILMADLQTTDVCIPSIEFKNPNHEDYRANTPMLEEQLYAAIQANKDTIAKAVESYGHGDIQVGMDQLLRHFEDMETGKPWKDSDYVFTVILVQLRHGAGSKDDEDRTGEDEDLGDNSKTRSLSVMRELTNEVPILYIHIPDSMRVVINKQRLKFQYWERRLTELTLFSICVDTKNSWQKEEFWKSDGQQPDSSFGAAAQAQQHTSTHRTYLRVFCGFDSYRAVDKLSASPMSLMIYSREAGRRLVYERDARSLLGLTHGGSDFCQGVTILLDDYQSTLPLNPTKQGLAFGKEEHGMVHKENLYTMLGAVAHCYWNYHYDAYGKSKKELTNAVVLSNAFIEENNKRLLQQEQDVVGDQEAPELPVSHGGIAGSSRRWHAMDGLGEGTFRRFEGIEWRRTKGAYKSKLRCGELSRKKITVIPGRSSVINFSPPQRKEAPAKSAPKRRRSGNSATGVTPNAVASAARNHLQDVLREGDNFFNLDDDYASPSNHAHARKIHRSSLETYSTSSASEGRRVSRRPGREESKEDYESAVLTSQRNQLEREQMLEERQNDKRIIQQLMEQKRNDKEKIMQYEAKLQEANVKLKYMSSNGVAPGHGEGQVDIQAYAKMEQQVLRWKDVAKGREEELRIEREKNYELSMRNDELLNDSRMQLKKRRELERELEEERNRNGGGSVGQGGPASASNGSDSSDAVRALERRVEILKKECNRHCSNVKMYKALSEKRGQEIDEMNRLMVSRAEEKRILEERLRQYEDSNDSGDYV